MGLIKISVIFFFILATYSYLYNLSRQDLPVIIDGYYHPAFKPVADKFRENLKTGKERGGSFAVFHKGECVFDMWGGYADVEAQRPWREDTITMAYSTSKGVAAVVVATMVEKGLLDYNRPVAEYWPEFGQKEKGNITVAMLLSHQGGLVILDELVKLRDIKDDPEKVERILAAQATFWPAGSQFGYHPITFGMYVDTLIRKVDPRGRDVTQVFMEDFAKPYGLDMFMNTPKDQYHRSARIYITPAWKMLVSILFNPRYFSIMGNLILFPKSLFSRSVGVLQEFGKDMHVFNDPHLREVHMSSAMATGTARGFAKLFGILANGGTFKGKQLLSKDGVSLLSTPLVTGRDAVIQRDNVSYGPGMMVEYNSKGEVIFGHPGHGGQVVRADITNHLGYAYLTNFISIFGAGDDPRLLDLEQTMYACLDSYLKGLND